MRLIFDEFGIVVKDMGATDPAYLEVIDFLAGGTSAEALVAFRPSDAVQRRVSNLLASDKEGELDEEERQELADFLQLEH